MRAIGSFLPSRSAPRRARLWGAMLLAAVLGPACADKGPHDLRTRSGAQDDGDGVSYSHGFNGTATEGLALAGGAATPLVFTGDALMPSRTCADRDVFNGLADQAIFLSLWDKDGKGQRLHDYLIRSLGETDASNTRRPTSPILPNSVAAVGTGADASQWRLNAIRIRLGNPVHVKFNFELPVDDALADNGLGFAALIHGVAIPQDLAAAFTADVGALSNDPRVVGCQLAGLLKKYVYRGSYMFAHGNFLVNDDWRFFEAKLVEFRGATTVPAVSGGTMTTMRNPAMTLAAMMTTSTTTSDPGTSTSISTSTSTSTSTVTPVIRDVYASPMGSAGANVSLEIVKMGFPFMKVTDAAKGTIATATDRAPYVTFVSSTKNADELKGMLLDATGQRNVAKDSPAFGNEPAHTCAGCHVSDFGMDVDPGTGKLRRVVRQSATHIAFTQQPAPDGATLHGSHRGRRAMLSDFLLKSAGGLGVNLPGFADRAPAAPDAAQQRSVQRSLRKLQCVLVRAAADANCAAYVRQLEAKLSPTGTTSGTSTSTMTSTSTSTKLSR